MVWRVGAREPGAGSTLTVPRRAPGLGAVAGSSYPPNGCQGKPRLGDVSPVPHDGYRKGTRLPAALRIEYCGEWHDVRAGEILTIGREADLVIDDNPALAPVVLEIFDEYGMWWIASFEASAAVQVGDPSGRVSGELAPGHRMPLAFEPTHVVFAAGRTTYEFAVHGELPYSATATSAELRPDRVDLPRLTANQRLLLVVLCERALRRPSGTRDSFPTSAEAAARLGWSLTAFNRKLDNVCDRLARVGVAGLRGGRGRLATRRRERLIEYALAHRLVTVDDLALLPDSVPEPLAG